MIPVTIRHLNRRCYAVWSDYLSSAPILRQLWWLLDVQPGQLLTGAHASLDYGKVTAPTNTPFRERVSVGILDGKTERRADGQAEAAFVKEIPIPPPKVRAGVEVRWNEGRWQKYLKAKGWVDLPLYVPEEDT